MKALITAGGRGTRLRPITHTRNKHLIPIANKPMLHYALEHVAEAGIREVGMIINQDDAEVTKAIGDGKKWGLKITYIPQESPRGLADCVRISQDFIGDEPFVFYLGDNMVVGGIRRFMEEFEGKKSNCHLTLAEVKEPRWFGVPEIKGGRIVSVEEKPEVPKSSYAVSGIYFYDSNIFEAVNSIEPSARGELEISDAHQYLISKGFTVTYSEITGWWKDTGQPSDLLEANRLVLENQEERIDGEVNSNSQLSGMIVLEKGASVIDSHIRGPAIIGTGTVVENSYVGPFTSIYNDCRIRNSEVEFSIVLAHCEIIDVRVRIESSLLGDGARVVRSGSRPVGHHFIAGDGSVIELG